MNIDKVFEFIKDKRGYEYPFLYKVVKGLPLSDDELEFKKTLDLSYTNIKSLPDNLRVGSNLLLFGTNLKSLPNNLYVGSSLFLNGVGITSIPNNLYVGGNLFLRETPLSAYYSTYDILKMIEKKGGHVGGSING